MLRFKLAFSVVGPLNTHRDVYDNLNQPDSEQVFENIVFKKCWLTTQSHVVEDRRKTDLKDCLRQSKTLIYIS
jgi:hypothetical protein